MNKPIKCPACRSENLFVIEVHEEWGSTEFGAVYRDKNGNVTTPSDFQFSPGDPIKAWLECECGKQWKPRGAVVSSWTSADFIANENEGAQQHG